MVSLCSKKGDLPDMLVFIITLFIIAIGLIILAFVIPTISTGLGTAGLNASSEGSASIDNLTDLGVNGLQRGFLFLFMGLIASLMITSFLVRTHPIFIFLYVLFLIVTTFVGSFLANAYETFGSNTTLSGTLASQTLITTIMENLVLITIAVGALSMIIVFAKFSSFSRSGGNAL